MKLILGGLKMQQEKNKLFEGKLRELIVSTIEETLSNNTFKEWMSISEASKYASVSYNTFSKFRAMGLKICEIDGIKRISRKEIDNFLEDHSF